jgi:F-type H+-transporting ATPase subunit delta
MRGISEASRDAGLRAFDPVANSAGVDGARLASELFGVVDTLDSSGSLRRALTDPARPGTDKRTLVASLFGHLDARTVDVVTDFAARRWWDQNDMGQAIEDAAVNALLASAEQMGLLEAVEEELFRIERIIASESELHTALDLRTALPSARIDLANSVFGSRISPPTHALLTRAAGTPRGRRFATKIGYYIKAAAARRAQTVAHVTAATELNAHQRERLTAALCRSLGRDIKVNVSVDQRVIGGIRVQVGDEVIDGTIMARLDDARGRLVG